MPDKTENQVMIARFAETMRLHQLGTRNIRNAILEEFPGINVGWLRHFFKLWMGQYENEYEGSRHIRLVYMRSETLDRPSTPCPCRRGDLEPDLDGYVRDIRLRSNEPPPGFGADWRLSK